MQLVVLVLVVANSVWNVEGTWNTECPRECACYSSEFKDLPVYKWIAQEVPKDHTYLQTNEVEKPTKEELKTATCVLEKGGDHLLLMHLIPSDVQALSLLQSPDSGPVVLDRRHFLQFQNLTFLEVQGYRHNGLQHISGHHGNRPEDHEIHLDRTVTEGNEDGIEEEADRRGRVVLSEDVFRGIERTLLYLNLQFVSLHGRRNGTEPALSHLVPQLGHELVFAKPEDEEVVPYVVYKSEQERKERGIPSTFANLTQLRLLRAHSCGLRTLDWELLQGCSSLTYLSLERNGIRHIPDFAFHGAPNLRQLSLAHNKLLHIHSSGLIGLPSLEKLDLSHNEVPVLSELSFPSLPSLKWLDLHGNPIEAVYPGSFSVLNSTKWLHIGSKTQGLELHPGSLTGLDSLEELIVTNVSVTVLDRDTMRGAPSLRSLTLHGAVWKVLYDAFLDSPRIETVVMSHCEMRKLSMDAFVGLNSLIKLDLSHNKLSFMPPGIFDDLASLRELWLQGNSLSRVPSGLFRSIPTAKLIRLQHNPWHCTCDLKELRPAAINKVRQKGPDGTVRYHYSKRVAPTCATPKKFNGMGVFDVMRKELRCGKKTRKGEEKAARVDIAAVKKLLDAKRTESLQNSANARTIDQMKKGDDAKQADKVQKIGNPEIQKSQTETIVASNDPEQFVILDKDNKEVKVSKKAWKLEQERKKLALLNKLE